MATGRCGYVPAETRFRVRASFGWRDGSVTAGPKAATSSDGTALRSQRCSTPPAIVAERRYRTRGDEKVGALPVALLVARVARSDALGRATPRRTPVLSAQAATD
jgi:hypothetical protein